MGSAVLGEFKKWLTASAVREATVIWGLSFAGILVSWVISPQAAKVVATVGFLYLPLFSMELRHEDYAEFGFSRRRLGLDVRDALLVMLVIFPPFIGLYVGFMYLLPVLPQTPVHWLTPYVATPHFAWRLPDRFAEWVVDQLFVVALPEEFFYRGFIQTRLRDAWPQGKVLWGARLGPAFWLTAILFSVGHLAIFEVWRLGVFFPALVFGWMRERSGSVVGAALFHAASNLLVLVLNACFFGP